MLWSRHLVTLWSLWSPTGWSRPLVTLVTDWLVTALGHSGHRLAGHKLSCRSPARPSVVVDLCPPTAFGSPSGRLHTHRVRLKMATHDGLIRGKTYPSRPRGQNRIKTLLALEASWADLLALARFNLHTRLAIICYLPAI